MTTKHTPGALTKRIRAKQLRAALKKARGEP
jgi:hypothetical protein